MVNSYEAELNDEPWVLDDLWHADITTDPPTVQPCGF
jgi:hypothetical protein